MAAGCPAALPPAAAQETIRLGDPLGWPWVSTFVSFQICSVHVRNVLRTLLSPFPRLGLAISANISSDTFRDLLGKFPLTIFVTCSDTFRDIPRPLSDHVRCFLLFGNFVLAVVVTCVGHVLFVLVIFYHWLATVPRPCSNLFRDVLGTVFPVTCLHFFQGLENAPGRFLRCP